MKAIEPCQDYLMNLIRLKPPGTWCQDYAVFDVLKPKSGQTFIEVGCGSGDLAFQFVEKGLTGYAIESSEFALLEARAHLANAIANNKLKLLEGDFKTVIERIPQVDIVYSLMVIEHLEDDATFVKMLFEKVKPGGQLLIGAPARMDKWGAEDEIAGHYRRYEKDGLEQLLLQCTQQKPRLFSIGVPTINLLKYVSDFLVHRAKKNLLNDDMQTRTAQSGVLDVPMKTAFPTVFKFILNPVVMLPFILVQKIFYRTRLGLVLFGVLKKPLD